jgi:hypothetical protein
MGLCFDNVEERKPVPIEERVSASLFLYELLVCEATSLCSAREGNISVVMSDVQIKQLLLHSWLGV